VPRAVPPEPSPAQARPSELRRLVRAARRVRRNAHAPYSKFAVGAAVLTDAGRLYVGCNVENGSYGATLCAERGAIAAAVADGARRLIAAAVVTGVEPPSPPCGICLQSLAEFMGPGGALVLAGVTGVPLHARVRLDALFPNAFQLHLKRGRR